MRLREVFVYELQHRLRSPATWTYGVFLALVMYWGLVASADVGPVYANAPGEVAQRMVMFGGLFGLLVSAALFADAALRDVSAGMEPLVYTTRLRKTEYLGGHFLAALVTNAVLLLAVPLGFFAASVTLLEEGARGPFMLAAYVQPFLLFMLPNLVLVGALLYSIGALMKQSIPVYLGAIALFVGYIVAANYWSAIENPTLAVVSDPFGLNALQGMMRYWSASEQNTRLVGFPLILIWNRVLWLGVAAAMLGVLHRRFRFAHADDVGQTDAPDPSNAAERVRWTGEVPNVHGVFNRETRVRQTLTVARQSLAETVSGQAFKFAMLAAIGLVLLWGWNVGETVFDTTTWPVTYLVVTEVLYDRMLFVPWLIIALYAGDLVWKQRETGTSEIADAIPAPTGVMLIGRFLALVAIVVIFHGAFLIGGLLVQALHGYYKFELGLYLRVLFGLKLLDHVILAAVAMMIHVLVNQKYVGHIAVVMACLVGPLAGPLDVPYLAAYNSAPPWTYSQMNGFGPALRANLWFKAYWAAWALLLLVVATLLWVRGRESGVRARLAFARARLVGPALRTAGVACALILLLGGFVFYNTEVLNDNPARDEVGRWRAEYERRYRRFANVAQPEIVAANLRVDIYPERSAADLVGEYRLLNRTSTAIDSLHVMMDPDLEVRMMRVGTTATQVLTDDETGYRIFVLRQSLQPGDSVSLSFDIAHRPRGFRSSTTGTSVVRNGSYLDRRWVPFIGYQSWFELSDNQSRQRFGLAEASAMRSANDPEGLLHDTPLRNEDRVLTELVVGTSGDQTPLAPGMLRRTWTESGRRYAHYGTDRPSPFGASMLSATYHTREDAWNDVALQIFHHPSHAYNVDRMFAGMKSALDLYTTAFGPYQYPVLRIAEIPPYGINGRALATIILFAEPNFINRNEPGLLDATFFGTAHEVAHSWWGGQLRTANVRGAAFLSEGVSNYSAMLVTERVLGDAEVRRVYDYQMDRYLSRRASFTRDVPLVEVEDHPHIAYGKGAVALYALRELVGDSAVNGALRRLVDRHRNSGPPFATAPELVAELRAFTPDSMQYLITDLFETVTLSDITAERADVVRVSDTEYRVSFDIVANKVRVDSVGRETDTPMNDFIEVGVFATNRGGLQEPLYLERHRLRSGKQRIVITVAGEPDRAIVDPERKLIERDRDDNVITVTPARDDG